jgi:hypothetical protein
MLLCHPGIAERKKIHAVPSSTSALQKCLPQLPASSDSAASGCWHCISGLCSLSWPLAGIQQNVQKVQKPPFSFKQVNKKEQE